VKDVWAGSVSGGNGDGREPVNKKCAGRHRHALRTCSRRTHTNVIVVSCVSTKSTQLNYKTL
jgi:hypothetical protein